MPSLAVRLCLIIVAFTAGFATLQTSAATVGSIVGTVNDLDGLPISQATITAVAPSGRYVAQSDAGGRFVVLGVVPDQYSISITAPSFEPLVEHVTVYPDQRVTLNARLVPEVRLLGRTVVRGSKLGIGQTTNQYTIVDTAAKATRAVSPAGLSTYVRGTVAGALASVPGAMVDTFGDALIRGAKADETIYTYDGIPIPVAEVAEPGGNPIGASLATTGVAYTNVNPGAFSVADPNALAGVVDEVAATGTYPSKYEMSMGEGILGRATDVDISAGWSEPSLATRTFMAARVFSDAIEYGDPKIFYGSEAGTYGLALHSQGGWSAMGNLHFLWHRNEDVQLLSFGGQSVYNLYGTPFSGLTYGTFGPYPQAPSAQAPVTTPTRVRGTYGVQKIQMTHSQAHSLTRLRLYRSDFGSIAFGPFWDDLSFPNGPISLASATSLDIRGAGVDIDSAAAVDHEIRYGASVEWQRFAQTEIVPTVPELLTSNPLIRHVSLYAADRWEPVRNLKIDLGIRATSGLGMRSDGVRQAFSAFDPRGGVAWRLERSGNNSITLSIGKYSQLPQPLELERIVRIGVQPPQSFQPLSPERASDFDVSFGHVGPLSYKVTAFARKEVNLIDVIPTNFKAPLVVSGTAGSSTGVALPQNVGEAHLHGFELDLDRERFSLAATFLHGQSSSASQYGLNDLNAPAAAAGHLFPLSYAPALQATASYLWQRGRLEVGPSLTYQSGYPFGNGKKVFIYCTALSWACPRADGRPAQVPNDNNVNPGYNYYFLADPSRPYCPIAAGCAGGASFNPFIGNLGTAEGDDPYSLTSPPALMLALHIGAHISAHVFVQLEATNLLNDLRPNQYVGNPYLIGPPGYRGAANCATAYAKYYGGPNGIGSGCYTLGNGIPTLDGQTPALPWSYGIDGYVPSSFPAPRTIYLRATLSNI